MDVMTPYEEPRAEPSNTRKEHLNAAEDEISVEAVEAAKEIDNIPELNDEAATIQQDQPLAVEETDKQCHEAVDDQIAAELVQDEKGTTTLGAQDINMMSKSDAEVEELFTVVLSPSAVEEDPVDLRTMVNHADEQQTSISRTSSELVEVLIEASEQGNPSLKTEHGIGANGEDNRIEVVSMELPDSFVAPDDSSMTPMQVTCQRPPGCDDDSSQTVSRNAYKQDPYVQEFCISISNRLANVETRTLPLPRLKYHDTSWEVRIPSIGQRNVMHKKVVHGGSVRACINFSPYVRAEIAPQLCNELIEICRTSGMVFEMNPVLTIQCAAPEHCDGVSFTDLKRARAVVPENNQSFSKMEVVMLNKNFAQDEFEETSNVASLADDNKVEAVSMELQDSLVAPDDAPMVPMHVDCQVSPKLCYKDSSMQSPEVTIDTVVGELESVNGVASWSSNHSDQEAKVVVPESDQPLSDMEVVVLNMNIVQDEFEETSNAAGDCKVESDGITETPNVTLKRDCSLKMEELCTDPSPFIAEEPSLGERIAAGSTEEPTCSTRIQLGVSNFQSERGAVDMLKDYDADRNVHVEHKNKEILIMGRSAGKDNERSKDLELPEEVHGGVVVIEKKVHFDDMTETPYVNLKVGVAACKDESMCPAPDLLDSSSLQNAEGDVNMIEEAGRELDVGVEPVVYSVRQNGLDETSPGCAAEKDNKKSGGSDILETVSCAMLVRTGGDGYQEQENREPENETEMKKAAAETLIICVDEGSIMKRTKACYTDQSMNPRRGQTNVSGPWIEEGCWIHFIQVANGRMWARTCRDFQIHHVQPD